MARSPKKDYLESTVWLPKDVYWCLSYLKTVMNVDISKLICDSLSKTLISIEKSGKIPPKPSNSRAKRGMLVFFSISPELRKSIDIVRINNQLSKWRMSDFIRVSLMASLKVYMLRYPEMEKIVRRFADEDFKLETGELQDTRKPDSPPPGREYPIRSEWNRENVN
jgi:hypothetical protein